MVDLYQIPVERMNDQFLESLREKYPHSLAEIRFVQQPPVLSDAEFWGVIDRLDWSKEGDDDAVIAPAVSALAALPLRSIYGFADVLARKLYELDTRRHAAETGENALREPMTDDDHFSADEFLYARCCVVANGKSLFEKVLRDPAEMPKDLEFESLLTIAGKAYRAKTGRRFDYVPAWSIETFANKKGWQR